MSNFTLVKALSSALLLLLLLQPCYANAYSQGDFSPYSQGDSKSPFEYKLKQKKPTSLIHKIYRTAKNQLAAQLTDLSQANPAFTPPASGFFAPAVLMNASIGDYTFKDCNSNGINDGGDSPLANVRIYITGTDVGGNMVSDSTLSQADGSYIFDNLNAGTYVIRFGFPIDREGFAYTSKDSSPDETEDSDADEGNGETDPVTLAENEVRTDIDAGYLDVQPPQAVDLVDPLILSCSDTIPNLLFTDNCTEPENINIISESNTVIADDDCETRIKRGFLLSDECNNVNSICQIVILRDTTPPTATGLDTLVLCPDDAENLPPPTFTDDCDDNPTVSFLAEGTVPVDDCEFQIQRLFEATDACGNSEEYVQIITVRDTAALTVVSEPGDLTFECALGEIPFPELMNSCGEMIPVAADTVITPGSCTNNFVADINFTSDNDCYDYNFSIQITVTDSTPPALADGDTDDVQIECGDPLPPFTLTFADNCGGAVTQTPAADTTVLACGFSIEQSVTATDICGNDTTVSRTVTVVDTTAPTLEGVPEDLDSDCENDQVPPPAEVTAFDTCDGEVPVTLTQDTTNMACAGTFMITRTWTATDNCGNAVSDTQVITVGDDGPPVIDGVPDDLEVDCELPPLPPVTASDNCGEVTLTMTEITPADTCQTYTVTRTYTAVDDCGNETVENYTITVNIDFPTAPDMLPELIVACDEAISDPVNPTLDGGCYDATFVNLTEEETPGDCPQEFSVERTFNYEDDCGNTFTITQTVQVVDTVAPVLTILEPMLQGLEDGDSIFLECDAMVMMNEDGATAVDNCDDDVTVQFMEMLGENADCTEDGYISHMICGWKATDDCGNQGQIFINFFIIDSTPPMLFGVPDDVTGDCTFDLTPPNVGVMDNCDFDVELTTEETESGDPCERIIVRTYTATDHCGNTVSDSYTITLIDDQAPVLIGVPADTTVTCSTLPEPPHVTATDDCDENPTVEYTQVINGDDFCEMYTVIRTWKATDFCGNTTSDSQTITVNDNVAPTLEGVPDDISVTCQEIPAPADVTATDDCDENIMVVFTETILGDECDAYQIIRTWTATDNCDNASTATQTISVADDVAPTLESVPDDISVSCNEIPAPANVTASDDCDENVEVVFTENIDGDECDAYQIIRTWTATDDCGQSVSTTQIINVTDDVAPTLEGVPDNISVSCNEIPAPANVTASDDCDENVEVDFTENINGDECDAYEIIRTWTTTDDCGQSVSATQIISVADDVAPTLEGVPDDATAQCDNIPPPANVTANDDCDANVTVEFTETETPGDCPQNFTLVRTWTATDACGQTTSASQIINVSDDTAPVLTFVNNDFQNGDTLYYVCEREIFDANDVTANDNCDQNPTVNFAENEIGNDPCRRIFTNTWTATDTCGNTATLTLFTVTEDNTPPVFDNLPADSATDCEDVLMPEELTASDNCPGEVTITVNDETTGTTCENFTVLRTYTATDACGNSTTATQTITVSDDEAPELSGVPEDISVECDAVPAPANVTATDNCAYSPEVIFTEQNIPGDCPGNYFLIRTWTATDDCGNETTDSQTIVVQDTTAPVISDVPADTTADCEDLPAGSADLVTVTDNCDDDPEVIFEQTTAGDDCDNFTIIRTWTATDNCGNSTAVTQTINVTDDSAPDFTNFPQDITFECTAEDVNDFPTATDNCDDDVEIILEEAQVDLSCGFLIFRIFTATDDCGNETTATQKITVTDTEAPVISGLPDDVTIECDEEIPPASDVTAADNCGEATLTVEEMITESGDCPQNFTIIRTYTATDDCGNETTATHTITVQDTTAPTLTFDDPFLAGTQDGDTVTLECGMLLNIEDAAVISDNCDADPEVIFTEQTTVSDDCEEDGFLVNLLCTWTVTDDCGNVLVFQITVLIVDTTAPVFDCPDNIFVDAAAGEEVPAAEDIPVTDNCTDELVLTFDETQVIGEDSCGYTLFRTFTATDECGNTAFCSQTVTVEEFCVCPDVIITDMTNTPETCVGNDGTFTVEIEDAAAYEYTLIPNLGTSNDVGNAYTDLPADDYLLVIIQPDVDTCETKIFFTIEDSCSDCDVEVFAENNITAELTDCNAEARICLEIEQESVTDYDILLNGETYTGSLLGCTFDTIYSYATSALPGAGFDGPYTLTAWTVDGTEFSGEFDNLVDLIQMMNAWDAGGNWQLMSNSIIGGRTGADYSSITITQNGTGAMSVLTANTGTNAVGISVSAPMGEHEFIFTHTQTGCADTAQVSVICSPLISPATEYIEVPENRTEEWCLDVSELPGAVISVQNHYDESLTQRAISSQPDADNCLTVSGKTIGSQTFTFIACDDFGFCDTTYLQVNVTEAVFASADVPFAVDDELSLIQGEPVMIDVCENDELNGEIERHTLLSQPASGRAYIESNRVSYTPAAESCDEVRFSYEICNDMGCDDAEIIIHYLCDEIEIYGGFSPNNDGVNDAFTIAGLARYPHHRLQVFNRWGSLVFASENYQNDWQGTHDGFDLPDGTYFYLLESGEERSFSGFVELRR